MALDLSQEEQMALEELKKLESEGDPKEKEKEEEATPPAEEATTDEPQAPADTDDLDEEEEEEIGGDKRKKNAFARMRKTLKEERERGEKLAQELRDMRERQARLEGMQEARRDVKTADPEPDVEPDKDLEPDEWRDWKIKKQEEQINKIANITKQQVEKEKLANELRGIEFLENKYKEADPEYDDKVKYLIKLSSDRLRLLEPDITDEAIQASIMRDKLEIARNAYEKRGKNPAEIFAQMAVLQGYVSAKNKSKEGAPKQVNIDAINKNMKKNASLIGGTPHSPAGDEISPEELLNMSLEKMLSINPKRLNSIVHNSLE